MDDKHLQQRRNEVLNKLITKFKVKKENAQAILSSLEKYCELIIHSINRK